MGLGSWFIGARCVRCNFDEDAIFVAENVTNQNTVGERTDVVEVTRHEQCANCMHDAGDYACVNSTCDA